MLKKFDHYYYKSVSTPFDFSVRLNSNMRKAALQLKYAREIGYLMCDMISTRPNIGFIIRKLSRYTSNPSQLH